MRKFLLFHLFLSLTGHVVAQDRPAYLPEDVETNSLVLQKFSQPGILNKSRSRGIEFSLTQIAGSKLVAEDGSAPPEAKIDYIRQLLFTLKVPVINKDHLRILLGYSYRPEQYHFESFGNNYASVFQHLDGRWLKSQQMSLFVNKALNEKHYLVFRAKLAYNGDYKKFMSLDKKYQVFTATALFGAKKNENMEWGVGLNFTNSFRSTIVLPFVMYNRNFNDKFGIELVLPVLALGRWNLRDGTLMLLGAEYSSRSYAIDVKGLDSSQAYAMNHSEFQIPLQLEQRIHSWLWIGAQVGYQYNFSTDFDADNHAAFKVEPKSSPYFKIGFFLSPPDDFDL